ncbi:MAG: glutathione S-transferase family protein [Alphaproteobacteria bacterium]
MLTLYHSPLQPASRKIRLMLREKNIAHELKQEDFWQRRIEFFALNPAGEVPVLTTDKGQPVCGSYAIAEYLDETFPEVQFFGNSPLERAEVRRLVEWFDSKFAREVDELIPLEKMFKRLMG